METIFEDLAINLIRNENIQITEVKKLIFGENNFVVPAIHNGDFYFFKFFTNPNLGSIKNEVLFVNYLKRKGSRVPDFLTIDGNMVFIPQKREGFRAAFFATKQVKGTSNPPVTIALLENTIEQISSLHLNIMGFDNSIGTINQVTDFQQLINFYVSNRDFFLKNKLDKMIEKTITLGYDETAKYPIHSDIRFENIVFENNSVKAFIDFTDLRQSCFEDDLGRFFQYLAYSKGLAVKDLQHLAKIYQKATGIILSSKNLRISLVFNTIYRYYFDSFQIRNKDKHEITLNILNNYIDIL